MLHCLSRILVIATGVASVAVNGLAMGFDVVTLASSNQSQAPYRFRNAPIEITFDITARDLTNRMREAHVGPPIKLALEEVTANRPPGYLLKVFMGVVSSDPSLRAARFLGYLSLYDLQQQRLLFDVTEPIGDLLTVGGDLNLVVTIRTAEAAESRELPDSAEILIGRASFIAQ
jgi:hypothetical protein